MTDLECWQEKAQWAKRQRDASLAHVEPPLQGVPDELPLSSQGLPQNILAPREIEITESYGIIELLTILRERKISVEEVTRAFLRRAALAQAATNCLTELLWNLAIEREKYLDSLPEPKGALFGLPISTKEHQGMVGDGVTTSAGISAWLCVERDAYRARYAEAWSNTGKDSREVDVILCPPSFGAATPHEKSRYWGYTSQWNLLDYPAVVFPVTKVDPVLDVKDVNYAPKNDQDKAIYDMYSPDTFQNAPVSLQVVGRKQEDEKVLATLVEIERAKGRK
ncbi:hypothetical protein FALBO_12941 [Fusarium albosuccineum]|uniref:Amidase domain-containing protein n=1 Tax=Fusarium albosuccineum TaxID=1237068 RepID=A0A8H4P8N7_9HYPO|nr:hypothetical protein FALBO_12941 [Fusarium albosuccineum]